MSRGDKDREQPSSKSPLTRHRKIQLALTLTFEERPRCIRAAAPEKTKQNVIMAVEDRHTPMSSKMLGCSLHRIELGADRYFFQRHSHLDVARQVGIVEFVLDVFMWDFDLRELNGDDLRRDNVRRLL